MTFEEALVASVPALRRYTKSLCPAIADDLAQEACARALANREKIGATVGDLTPWLCFVARNIWKTLRFTQRRFVPDPDGVYAAHCGVEPEQERYVAFERRRAAFARLRPERRRVAELVHLLGYTEQEAADTLGIPRGTVKSRLSRGLAEIRS